MQLDQIIQSLKPLPCSIEGDATLEISGVASLTDAQPGDLSFVSEAKFVSLLEQTQASAVFADPTLLVPAPITCIRTPNPRLAFAKTIELFYQPFQVASQVHPSAHIAPDVQLGSNVAIGPNVVIEAGVIIGAATQIHANVVIYPHVSIGAGCVLFANCVIHERTQIGQACLIHSGAVIGDDGFGHVPQADGTWYRMVQSGRVVLEDGVDIGSNSTIDRPAVGETRIQTGSKIDNLVQVGHGVQVGPHSVLAAQVGVAGGTQLGHHVVLGGQVGVTGHIQLGHGATAVARSGITNSVPAGQIVGGYPHQPHREWLRSMSAIRQLPDLVKTIHRLEKKLEKLETQLGL